MEGAIGCEVALRGYTPRSDRLRIAGGRPFPILNDSCGPVDVVCRGILCRELSLLCSEFGVKGAWFGHSRLVAGSLHPSISQDLHAGMPAVHVDAYCFFHLSLLVRPIARYAMPIVRIGNAVKNE